MATVIASRVRHALFLPVYLLVATSFMLIIVTITEIGFASDVELPMMLAGFLCGYLAWEVRREIVARGAMALLSPAVLASLIHFYLSYCVPMLGMAFDDHILSLVFFWTGDAGMENWISYAMIVAGMSAIAFWRGYRFFLWRPISGGLKNVLRWSIKTELNLNIPIIIVLAIVSIGARLIQIKLGVFGYASDNDSLYKYAAYRSYLDYATSFGTLALFLIAWQVFSRRSAQNIILWLILIPDIVLEIGFGFLSGFKGSVMMPALVIGAAYFFARGRIPVKWAIAAMILLIAAYAVIEPFREIRNEDSGFDSTSIVSIWNSLESATDTHADIGVSINSFAVILERSELISTTTAALEYKDTSGELGPNSPDFLTLLMFAPIYAVIPRVIWPEKPTADAGRWFAIQVLGSPESGSNSVGMGPESYFYFAGGITGVILGFFGLGILYRVLFEALTSLGAGGWLIYFTILSTLVVISSEVGAVLAGLVQVIPLAVLLQAVVLKKSRTMRTGSQAQAKYRFDPSPLGEEI